MKFTIKTDALASALRIASVGVMGGRSTLPILGNILIEAKGSQIILSTTNLDIYVIQKIDAEVKKEGATTAPFSILSQLVGRMQSSTIDIAAEKGGMSFKSGEVLAELETLEASEFPPPVPTKGEGVDCEAQDILKPFSLLAHAMSVDSSRFALMGINIAPKGEFAASDGWRLAFFTGKDFTTESVILPDSFVRSVLKIAPEGDIKVFIGNGHVTIISKDVEITSKLVEATYPSFSQAIPKRTKQAFSCGRKPLIHALQTCSIFSHVKTPGLNLSGLGKEVEVSQPGKASERVMGTELAGQPEITIKLNEKFLIDTLAVLEEENVRIQITDATSPVMIEEGKFKEIIMPMRTT